MSHRLRCFHTSCLCLYAFLLTLPSGSANPVINEIFYHENHRENAENPLTEWIEIYNPTTAAIPLANWELTRGVTFTFPAGASLPSQGYLIVAADPATFSAAHPGVTANAVFGPWTGRLRNSGETIELSKPDGSRADRVRYADEGDWATRAEGPVHFGHRGWTWEAAHDGGGSSLELISQIFSNNQGQNWAASEEAGGTPGAANSVATSNIAPLILNVRHRPVIPRSSDPITVTAEVLDEEASPTLRLHWRRDGEDEFRSVAMNTTLATAVATIPAQDDGTIVEFYLAASDGQNARTWPGPILPRDTQEANLLVQVDDSFDPNAVWNHDSQPKYRVIMTEDQRDELEDIGDGNRSPSNEDESNAEMNCTFIVEDGTGTAVRYLASVRNRGASSRSPPPNNFLVKFRSDDAWNGRASVKFNARYPHSQVYGSWYMRRLGVETADAAAVQLRINGTDLARSGSPMFGSYARVESFDSDYTNNHWPADGEGNFYQIRDDEDTGQEGDLRYEGEDPDEYRDTYFKQTNDNEDDWSDLIALTDALNNAPEETYVADLEEVMNVDQWLSYFAADTLAGNREGGLVTSKGDDYGLYRGINDQRFRLIPHDLDTVFNLGSSTVSVNQSIFTYDDLAGLRRFFRNDEIVQRYFAKLLHFLDGDYNEELLHAAVDDLVSYLPTNESDDAREFISGRINGVLGQIPRTFSATTNLPDNDGYHYTANGTVTFSGSFQAARCLSVRVNGHEAERDQRAGTWNLELNAQANFFKPGLNRVRVQAFSGKAGTGTVVDEHHLDVWYDTGIGTTVSGTLSGEVPTGRLHMMTRDSYLPANPVLVRLEFRNPDGTLNRDLWNSTASLSTNLPGTALTPNTVTIRNGLGSALVRIAGGAGGASFNLIDLESDWKYLDDGSNQGTSWREREFDDSSWRTGQAELGYGDGDENKEVRYGPNEDNDDNDRNNKYITTYFRKEFMVEDAAAIADLDMRIKRDDGMVVYLNGTPIARDNVPENPGYLTEASNGSSEERQFLSYPDRDHTLLVTGRNVIAVEMHQDNERSSDISFDLELTATGLGTDPGDITITASAGGQQVSQSLVSRADDSVTSVSGTLPGAETTWNGIIRLTADVTVPNGHLLTIEPGTLILVDGTPEPQSTTGTDLIIQGSVSSLGTAESPITFTATNPDAPWGQIRFDNSEQARFAYTSIHRAGHSPRGGHTNHGRVLRIMGSDVIFDHCTISDNRGKVGETNSQGGSPSHMTFRNCHWARSVMGIETFNTGVLMEDCYITDMLGQYREDGTTDDNDAIYLHGAAAGQDLILRRVVVANCEDDGIDTLGAENVVIDQCISRNVSDKGASLFGGSVTITRTLFTGCDIGLSAKDDSNVIMDFCTIVDNESIGVQAENKDGNDDPSFYTITNSIIWNNPDDIRTDYDPADITLRHTLIGQAWPAAGSQHATNLNDDPQFISPGSGNYHLSNNSPARDAADPALPLEEDGSRQDLGIFPFDPAFDGAGSELRWSADHGPYLLTDDATVPEGLNLIIEPGTNVFFAPGTRLRVEGSLQALGTPDMRIQFSSVPGAAHVTDPASDGLPDGPPKWDGIKIVDSMDPNNRIAHVDVRNAQHNEGSIGIIRSQCVIDDVSFSGTHIRMIFTDTSSVIIENSIFPDMFAEDEEAAALGLDNISEHIKGTGPVADGGRYIIRNNRFGTNKGHNDVIDVDSGRRPAPIVQILNNSFEGARDEELDLGGEVYIAGNVFTNIFKDDETSDRGYANGISTGDSGSDTTIVLARNIFWDVDHAINLKRNTATIFESNTVYKIHPDFVDNFDNTNIGSVINLFVPGDSGPTPGAGAYARWNIFTDIPRIFGNADRETEFRTFRTPLELFDNLIDPEIEDLTIGPEHPDETIFDLGTGNNYGLPRFQAPDRGDFRLGPGSPALGAGPMGADLGALIPNGIFITGEPSAQTAARNATLHVGGPGIFAYRYRINDGPWSDSIDIGVLGFDQENLNLRTDTIELTNLAPGSYTVFVQGQDFAGEWQEFPTASQTWTIDPNLSLLVINEVLASNNGVFTHQGTTPDYIELHNRGTRAVNLAGMSLSDNPADPTKFVFPGPFLMIGPGQRLVVFADDESGPGIHLGFGLEVEGETIALYQSAGQGGGLVDSISYGPQIPGLSIGRVGHESSWALNVATPGESNVAQSTGNPDSVVINEWLTSSDVLFDRDWLELFNADPLPVSLSGLSLTDHPEDPVQYVFPPLSFIAGNGFLKLLADANPDAGVHHLPFALDADQDRLALFRADGTLQDQVVFGPQTTDVSQGRWNNSSTGRDFFELPTGGLPNSQEGDSGIHGFDNALALLRSLRISEIMFEPNGGKEHEFIELRNIGHTTLDLEGVRFTDGIRFVFPQTFLAPGEEILIVADLAAFRARYGATPVVAGEFGGSLDNDGETLVLSLPLPFDAAILRFDYSEDWEVLASGAGHSLELTDLEILPRDYDLATSWQASPTVNGSPGGGQVLVPNDFPSWLTFYQLTALEDRDGDGLIALLEFALGLDPTLRLGVHGPSSLPVVSRTVEGQAVMSFSLPVNADAQDGYGSHDIVYVVETSADLDTWTPLATKTDTTSFSGPATVDAARPFNGRVRLTITDDQADLTERYLRLRVVYQP